LLRSYFYFTALAGSVFSNAHFMLHQDSACVFYDITFTKGPGWSFLFSEISRNSSVDTHTARGDSRAHKYALAVAIATAAVTNLQLQL